MMFGDEFNGALVAPVLHLLQAKIRLSRENACEALVRAGKIQSLIATTRSHERMITRRQFLPTSVMGLSPIALGMRCGSVNRARALTAFAVDGQAA